MEASPIRMSLTWSVPHEESRHIVSALQELMASTRAAIGCIACSLSIEMRQKSVIHYIEEWNTEDGLTRHLRSERFAALAELMEHASESPTIEFALPGSIRGVEYAQEIRGSATR